MFARSLPPKQNGGRMGLGVNASTDPRHVPTNAGPQGGAPFAALPLSQKG